METVSKLVQRFGRGGVIHVTRIRVIIIVTFCVSRRRRKMYCGHARLCVCLSVRGRMPTLLHGPDVTWGSGRGCPHSCALLGGFAIGARVALLWQHNANRGTVTSLRPSRDMTT